MPMTGGGGGGQAAQIEAGRAVVRLSADQAGLKGDLDKARRMVLGWGKEIAGAGAGVMAAGALVAGPILGAMYEAAQSFNEVRKAADQLGSTTEIVSGLAFAAKSAGVDLDGFVQAGQHLGKLLSEAAEGGNASAEAFARLGLDAKELVKAPLDEQFNAIADAIAGLPTQADQARAAMEFLGKSGKDMLPALRGGAAGLEEFKKKAEDLGAIVSTEDAKNAKAFSQAITQAKAAVGSLVEAIGASVLPQAARLKDLSDEFVQIVKGVRLFIEENRGIVVGVAAAGAAVVGLGGLIVAIGSGLAVATFAVGGFISALGVAGAVLAAVFSPVGLGIAALVVAGVAVAALVAEFGDLEAIGGELSKVGAMLKWVWGGLAETFQTTLGGIRTALAAGDLKLALEVAVAGLDVVWKGFLLGLQLGWNEFKKSFVDGWHGIILEVRKAWEDMVTALALSIAGLVVTFKEATGDAEGAAEWKAKIPEIARGNELEKKRLDALERLEQRERDAARSADALAAAAGLAAAKLALEDKARDANTALFAKEMAEIAGTKINFPKAAAAAGLGELASRGGFGGFMAGQAFGANSIANKIEKNTKDTAAGVKRLEDKVGGVPVE